MPSHAHLPLTRLDPRIPLLWRDERTLQLGLQGDLRIDAGAAWVEPLLGRLRAGFRRRAFDVIAHGLGAPREEARALLARLGPLLLTDEPVPRAAWVESVNVTDARAEYRMREALSDEGVAAGARADAAHVGVVLVQGAAAALQLAPYLRDDTSHLPIAFDQSGTTIGPLVIPGVSPCLACRDAHEVERDSAWPRMHAQLVGRGAGPISAGRIAEAAVLAARLLSAPEAGEVVRVGVDGARVRSRVSFHEECRCRALSSPSPRESATEPAPRGPQISTTRSRAFARPA